MSQPLSNLAPGSLVKLSETVSGVTKAVPFLVAAHGHHAPGRTTLLRQRLWPGGTMPYQKSSLYTNAYSGCGLDSWLTGTYFTYLEQAVQNLLADVSIRVGSGTATIDRALFLLSATELGLTSAGIYTEGTAIAYFNSAARRIGLREDLSAANYWTRSPSATNSDRAYTISGGSGTLASAHYKDDLYRPRPALTLPSALRVSDAADPEGSYLPSFAAGVPVRVSGAWQTAEPLAKASGAWCAARPKIKVSGAWYDAG